MTIAVLDGHDDSEDWLKSHRFFLGKPIRKGAAMEVQERSCPHCGMLNAEASGVPLVYCHHCGINLNASTNEIRQWLCAVESCGALYETRNGKPPERCECGSQLFREKAFKGN